MSDYSAAIKEAERRGIFGPKQIQALMEAERRGLVGSSTKQDIHNAARLTEDAVVTGLSYSAGFPGGMRDLADVGAKKLVDWATGDDPEKTPAPGAARGMVPRLPTPIDVLPNPGQVRDFATRVTGIEPYEPKTMKGRFAKAGIEGATAAATLGGNPAIMAPLGGVGGLGGQAGAELFPDSPWARVWGSIIATLGVGTPIAMRGGSSRIARDATEGITEDQWAKAARLQKDAKEMGAPITAPEALGDVAPDLLTYQQIAESSRSGAKYLRPMMDARNKGVKSAVEAQAREIGPASTPGSAFQTVKSAATKSITEADEARTAASSPYYTQAGYQTIPKRSIEPIITEIDNQIQIAGKNTQLGRELRKFKRQIEGTVDGDQVSVGQLNQIQKELRDRLKAPDIDANAVQKSARGTMGPLRQELRDTLVAENPAFRTGRQKYIEMSPAVDKLRNGYVGKLMDADSLAAYDKILLDPSTVAPSDIYRVANAIKKVDPNALPKFTRSYIERNLDSALKRTAREEQQYAGGKLYKAIAGTPQQRKNLEAVFRNLPEGKVRARAFENMLKVFEAQSRRLPAGSQTQPRTAAQAELSSTGLPIPILGGQSSVTGKVGTWAQQLRMAGNTSKLAEIFVSDDGVELLRELAKVNPSSRQADVLVATILSSQRQPAPSGQ